MSESKDLKEILAERGKTNGDYGLQSEIEQAIKEAIYSTGCGERMMPYMKSSIDQIAHKLGRISAGDVLHEDHWRDIGGYATLAADRVALCNQARKPETKETRHERNDD